MFSCEYLVGLFPFLCLYLAVSWCFSFSEYHSQWVDRWDFGLEHGLFDDNAGRRIVNAFKFVLVLAPQAQELPTPTREQKIAYVTDPVKACVSDTEHFALNCLGTVWRPDIIAI